MCALCGVLGGGEHWTDAPPRTRGSVASPPAERRRARAARVVLANRVLRHYGLSLTDWQATCFVLSSGTGRTEIVADLSQLWAAAERLAGRPCDPLDLSLIEKFEASHG